MTSIINYREAENVLYSDSKKIKPLELDHYGILYKSDQTLLHWFYPSQKVSNRCFVIFPGGAYSKISMLTEGVDIAKEICSCGDHAVVVQYRLPHGDIRKTLDSLYTSLEEMSQKILKEKIGIEEMHLVGFSAGGHLAGLVAGSKGVCRATEMCLNFRSLCLAYPVITMSKSYKDKVCLMNMGNNIKLMNVEKRYSLELGVNHDTIPSFIMYAKDDQRISPKHAQLFIDQLEKFRIQNKVFVIENGGHGFGVSVESDWFQSYLNWVNSLS
ncbi:prolyl oligopeptidase family serine peptidase [Prolixibacteraceae bacterium]|nr:prolyl oligopeptidase family serine peptidase [Prolixibacteraceae bacterium]